MQHDHSEDKFDTTGSRYDPAFSLSSFNISGSSDGNAVAQNPIFQTNSASTLGSTPVLAEDLGPNKLTGVAAKLFATLSHLVKHISSYHQPSLEHHLALEIKKFGELAKRSRYQDDTVILSQYVFCYIFDHVINTSSWAKEQHWQTSALTRLLPQAQAVSQNFNAALKKMCEMPERFIDVLELVYLSFALIQRSKMGDGFDSAKEMEEQLFTLYQVIQAERGEFEKRLSKSDMLNSSKIIVYKKSRKFFLSLAFGATMLIVLGLYQGFGYLTQQADKPIEQEMRVINE